MRIFKYENMRPVVFIRDPDSIEFPTYSLDPEIARKEPPILANSECISVTTLVYVDGESEFIVGSYAEVRTEETPCFDGKIVSPSRKIVIESSDADVLHETGVAGEEAHIRVWLSHPRWPETVRIAID